MIRVSNSNRGSRPTSRRKLRFEPLILLLQLSYKLVLRILINNRLVFNLFGSVGILEGTDSFVKILGSRSDGADHVGFGVSSQGVLQHSSKI